MTLALGFCFKVWPFSNTFDAFALIVEVQIFKHQNDKK